MGIPTSWSLIMVCSSLPLNSPIFSLCMVLNTYARPFINPSENGIVEVFNHMQCFQNAAFQVPQYSSQPDLHWKGGIHELLKAYRATALKPGKKCLAELFFGRPFRLDFQLPQKLPKTLAAHRVLLRSPFAIGHLVLTKRPQTPKGCSPYAGPYWVIEVVSCYTY